MIWLYCLAAVVSWVLWNVIHEMSHVMAANLVGNVKSWKIKPYPHKYNGKFRFAGAYWIWDGPSPAKEAQGLISLAPRLSNFVAIELAFLTFLLSGTAKMFLLIFCAAGVIDLIVGSIGYSDGSDLRKAADKLEVNPWRIRAIGLAISAIGIIIIIASTLH